MLQRHRFLPALPAAVLHLPIAIFVHCLRSAELLFQCHHRKLRLLPRKLSRMHQQHSLHQLHEPLCAGQPNVQSLRHPIRLELFHHSISIILPIRLLPQRQLLLQLPPKLHQVLKCLRLFYLCNGLLPKHFHHNLQPLSAGMFGLQSIHSHPMHRLHCGISILSKYLHHICLQYQQLSVLFKQQRLLSMPAVVLLGRKQLPHGCQHYLLIRCRWATSLRLHQFLHFLQLPLLQHQHQQVPVQAILERLRLICRVPSDLLLCLQSSAAT